MQLFNFRNLIKNAGDSSFIGEVVDFLISQTYIDPTIVSFNRLFEYSEENVKKPNQNDYKNFISKTIFKDYCNFFGISFKGLTPEGKDLKLKSVNANILRSINSSEGLAFNSCDFYSSVVSSEPQDQAFIINVGGENLFKVVDAVYKALKEQGVICTIRVPFLKNVSSGNTDNICVYVSPLQIENSITALETLKPDIIRLINKPSLMYARVNSYIGYDFYNYEMQRSQSDLLLNALREGIHNAVAEIISIIPNELIEHQGETIAKFRENTSNELYADLKILSRTLSVDPSLKPVAVNHITEKIKEVNRCEYAFSAYEQEYKFNILNPNRKVDLGYFDEPIKIIASDEEKAKIDELTAKLYQSTESILSLTEEERGALSEVFVQPSESEEETIKSEEKPINIEEEPIQLEETNQLEEPIQLEEADQLEETETVKEKVMSPQEAMLYEFQNRGASSENYLDNLLKGMQTSNEGNKSESESQPDGNLEVTQVLDTINGAVSIESENATIVSNPQKEDGVLESADGAALLDQKNLAPSQISEEAIELPRELPITSPEIEFLGETKEIKDSLVYENSAESVAKPIPEYLEEGLNPPESTSGVKEDIAQPALTPDSMQGVVPVPDITPEQIEQINSTLNEVAQAGSEIEKALLRMISSPADEEVEVPVVEENPKVADDLTGEEIATLVSNPIPRDVNDKEMKKYANLVPDLNILNTLVPGTDFTLFEYFEYNFLTNVIKANKRYHKGIEILTGAEVVNNYIIPRIIENGNVPLTQILRDEEISYYKDEKDKSGLFGMFKRK